MVEVRPTILSITAQVSCRDPSLGTNQQPPFAVQLLHLRPSNIKKFVIEFVDTKIQLAKTRDDWDL